MDIQYSLEEQRQVYGELAVFFAQALDRPRLTSKEVSSMTGVGATRISQWIARGQLKTEHTPAGTGHSRLFSLSEMGQVIALQVLIDAGVEISIAVKASWSIRHNFRAHFVHLAEKMQRGQFLTENDLSTVELSSLCINAGDGNKSFGFGDSVPFGEVLADMGESFFVINPTKVFGRVLTPHIPVVMKLIREDLEKKAQNVNKD